MVEDEDPNTPERDRTGLNYAAETQASAKHPERNEDAFCVNRRYIGVFDGISNIKGSDAAASYAAGYCDKALENMPERIDAKSAMAGLEQTLKSASVALSEYASGTDRVSTEAGVAAILTGVFTDPETDQLYVAEAHAGDCRTLVMRGGSKIIHTTLDHTVKFVDTKGKYIPPANDEEAAAIQKIRSEARLIADLRGVMYGVPTVEIFGRRNVVSSYLRCDVDENDVNKEVGVATSVVSVEKGDIVVSGSDGLFDNLTTDEILCICQTATNPLDIPRLLVEAATKRSQEQDSIRSKKDDITAGVVVV